MQAEQWQRVYSIQFMLLPWQGEKDTQRQRERQHIRGETYSPVKLTWKSEHMVHPASCLMFHVYISPIIVHVKRVHNSLVATVRRCDCMRESTNKLRPNCHTLTHT